MITFELKSKRAYESLWEALNETAFDFASYQYKCITVWSETVANMIKNGLDSKHYKYNIVRQGMAV